MITIKNGDIIQMTLRTQLGEQAGEIVRHYTAFTVSSGLHTLEDFVVDVNSDWRDVILPTLTTKANYGGIIMQHIYPLPVQVGVSSDTALTPGTGGSAALPGQVTGLIKLTTDFAGRRYRGRMYIPFPAESDNDDVLHIPVSAYMTKLLDIKTQALKEYQVGVDPNSTYLRPTLFHRNDHTTTQLTGTVSRQFWATQRRRGTAGRPNPIT